MITYHPNKGKWGHIDVKLDGKLVGQIKPESPPFGAPVDKAWRYWPVGVRTAHAAGSPFTSLNACKRSLEHDSHA